ncbi:MAG: hypothetical protein ACLGIA_06260 [Actinomycetes bacterium]
MPRFRTVEVYPMSGGWDQPWIKGDADADAFAKVSRGICDLYSGHLAEADLRNPVSTLRIFVGAEADNAPPASEDGRAGVLSPTWTGRPQGFEQAAVRVPAGFAFWELARQQRVVLDAVHAAARGVADLRGLDRTAFEQARETVEAAAFTFTWTGPWKVSPGRRWRARCTFRTMPDGFGRLVVQVAGPQDESPFASSSEQVAWTTAEGYRRAAKTLRWASPRRLEVIPSVGLHDVVGGTFVAELGASSEHPELHDVELPPPLGRSGT